MKIEVCKEGLLGTRELTWISWYPFVTDTEFKVCLRIVLTVIEEEWLNYCRCLLILLKESFWRKKWSVFVHFLSSINQLVPSSPIGYPFQEIFRNWNEFSLDQTKIYKKITLITCILLNDVLRFVVVLKGVFLRLVKGPRHFSRLIFFRKRTL